MARQTINIGARPNDGQGDPTRTAHRKANENFVELYDAFAVLAPVFEDLPPGTTLGSLATALEDAIDGDIATLAAANDHTDLAVAERLRLDDSGAYTDAQKAQGRSNLGLGPDADVSALSAVGASTTSKRSLASRFAEFRSAEDWRVNPATGAIRNDDDTLQRAFSSGANILLPKKYELASSTALTLTGNIHVKGVGRDVSGLAVHPFARTKNNMIFADGSGDIASFTDMSFWGGWGLPDPINSGQFLYSEIGPGLVVLKNINTVRFNNVAWRNSRAFSLQVRLCEDVEVSDFILRNSARDGIAVWDCALTSIYDGKVRGTADDAVSIHINSDSVRTRAVVSVENILIIDGHGVASLGAKQVTIKGVHGWRLHAQAVRIGGIVPGLSGDTPQFCVTVEDVKSFDQMNRSWFVDGSSAPAFAAVWIDSLPFQAGGLPAVPGFAAPSTGRVQSARGTLYENNVLLNNKPNGALSSISVKGIKVGRSLAPVSKYSDWGYGKAFAGEHGWLDYPVTDLSMRGTGIEVRGPIWDMTISDFDLAPGGYGIRFTTTLNGGQPFVDRLFHRVKVKDGIIRSSVSDAIQFYGQGTTLTKQDIHFDNIDIDPDSDVLSVNRGLDANGLPNGTWVSAGGGPFGIDSPYIGGLSITRGRFRNCAIPVNETGVPAGLNFYEGNRLYAQPAALNFSQSNRGVGLVRIPGTEYGYVITDCDPRSPTFEQVLNVPVEASLAMPSTGVYVAGHFVRTVNTAVAGTIGLSLGWTRLTTGSNHNTITAVAITLPGSGGTNGTYPLTVTTTTGSGAAGTATVSGGAITAVSLTSGGTGYKAGDTVSVIGSGVTGATLTPTISQDWAQLWSPFGGPNSPYRANAYLAGTNGNAVGVTADGPGAAYDVELRPKGGGAARMGLTGDKNAFYGAAGATRATLPAAATDANSTTALVNAIRAALIGTGQTS